MSQTWNTKCSFLSVHCKRLPVSTGILELLHYTRRKLEEKHHGQMSWMLSEQVTFMWCDSPWHLLVFHYKSERECFRLWVAIASGTLVLSMFFSRGQPILIVKHQSNIWWPAGKLTVLQCINLPFLIKYFVGGRPQGISWC